MSAEADIYVETPDLAATITPCLTDDERAALRNEPRFATLLP